jgi:E3 ubiquitin-protein ligase XBAT32/33
MAHKRLKKYSSALLPAHDAAAANDVSALREMFGGDLPAPPSLSEEDETPLHSAAREGADESVDWILKNTSIDSQCCNKMRETPAHLAAAGGHLKCLMKLVNADPARRGDVASTADAHGLTPLHHATVKGNVDIVRWLLNEFGDSVFAENDTGQLSVHFAASSGTFCTTVQFGLFTANCFSLPHKPIRMDR